ncbi:MAG: oligosaccharide flippase family protein [Cyanobacteria bacterium SBLK]|nr:oligosaccharide flippase family protein [Cyanobacteria bacterium SBLK]
MATIQTSLSQTDDSVKLGALAKNAATILILQGIGMALTYVVPVFLARWMGKTQYGLYEYAISWSLVLAIPASLGLPRAVLRFMSEYRVREEWGELRGLILRSWQFTAGTSLILCLAGIEFISFLDRHDDFLYAPVLLAGIWLIPLQAFIQLQEDMARGVDNIPLAYGPSKVLWPFFVLGGGFFIFRHTSPVTSIPMIRVALLMLFVVVVFQGAYLWFKFDREIGETQPIYKPRQWLLVALPLLFDRTFEILLTQTDIIMVGSLSGAGEAGIYTAASKTALWTTFILESLNLVASPAYAILYAKSDRKGLQKIVAAVTLWIFAPSVAIAATLAIFSQPILGLFGSEFLTAHFALKILLIGHLVDVLCGSVGNLMMMTGHQNKSVIVSGCCGVMNIGLNAVLIPKFGAAGAAIATTSTLVIWNICMSVLVIKYIKINPSIFYALIKRHRITAKD